MESKNVSENHDNVYRMSIYIRYIRLRNINIKTYIAIKEKKCC